MQQEQKTYLCWLKSLQPEALYKKTLDEYLLTYTTLNDNDYVYRRG